MDRIWVIGSKGMLGTELSLLFEKNGFPVTGTGREVDLTRRKTLFSFAENQTEHFGWIINCAAYTAVDKAENDEENCRLLNTAGAGNLAALARETGARLIHISTDYVFNGKGNRPYTEDDTTDPIGVYGLSKRDGEIAVLKENPRSYIIRAAWLYGRYGNNFVHTMLKLMKERERVSVVNDQRGSPTWTFDLASGIAALIKAVESGKNIPFGVYHYTDEGEITWFDFAREIYTQSRAMDFLTKECEIKPCTSAEFPAKVKRPEYSVLDKTKIKTALGINIPAWDKSLREFLTGNQYA